MVLDNPESLTFQLEGNLAGPWVRELEDCWRSTQASQPKPVLRFDLTGVTYIDAAGKAYLAVCLQNIQREQDDWCWAAVGQMVLCLRGLFSGNHSPEVTYLGRPKGLTSCPPPIS